MQEYLGDFVYAIRLFDDTGEGRCAGFTSSVDAYQYVRRFPNLDVQLAVVVTGRGQVEELLKTTGDDLANLEPPTAAGPRRRGRPKKDQPTSADAGPTPGVPPTVS